MVAQRLQGGYDAEQALLDGRVGQADEVDPDAAADVHLDGHGNGIDADAFRAVDLFKHIDLFYAKFGKALRHDRKKHIFVTGTARRVTEARRP